MAMQESVEQFGTMLRWTEQPKDAAQAEKTTFIGAVVQGFFVGKRDGVGQNNSTVYELLLADGRKVAFWGSDLLDGKFKEIPLDCEVRVSCLGTAQPKTPAGRPYLNFKVEFDKDSRKPANLVEAAAPGAQPVAVAPAPVAAVAAPVAAEAPVAAPAPVAGQGEGF